jgi:hypothetical protein
MSNNSANCTCNTTQNKTVRCCVCKTVTWSIPMEYHERVSNCKIHRGSIQICGFPVYTCASCKQKGFEGRTGGLGPCPPIITLNGEQTDESKKERSAYGF